MIRVRGELSSTFRYGMHLGPRSGVCRCCEVTHREIKTCRCVCRVYYNNPKGPFDTRALAIKQTIVERDGCL